MEQKNFFVRNSCEMAVKQSTTENEEKLPISRILDFINEYEQRALIVHDYSKIAKQIVGFLGYIDQPKLEHTKPDAKLFAKQIGEVDEYLRKISEQVDITKICSMELHSVLKMENPSAVAGIILHRLEMVHMPKFYAIFTDEQHMRTALNNLFTWMKFSFFIRNLDKWILKVLGDLQENKMFSILLDVSSKHIMQIAYLMAMPVTQERAEPVFFYILTSVQHTSSIFDILKSRIPILIESLRKDAVIQQRLVDTVKALIDHFNTFPDHQDYSHIEDVIATKYSVSSNYKQQLETPPWHDTSPSYQYITTNARVGLENLGNTCYMNSILQALALTKHFRQEMLFTEIKSNLFELLQKLLALLLHSNRPTLSPDMILKAACPPAFHEGHQQDCSEFLGYLLESLHSHEKSQQNNFVNQLNLPPNHQEDAYPSTVTADANSAPSSLEELQLATVTTSKTLVQKSFDGLIATVYKCLSCGTTSRQNDSFRDLHLSFPDTDTNTKHQYSIEDLLDYYCSMERLDADNKYFCDICKMLCDGERLINIVNPPRYLVLTLKYFKYDKNINVRTKLTHKVRHQKQISVKVLSDDGLSEHVQYRLYAAVVHSGVSMDSGHYYTYGSDQPDDGSWYKFNDSLVTECNITALNSLRSPNTPYVLFYERECDEDNFVATNGYGDNNYNYPSLNDLPSRLRTYVDRENSRYEMEKRLRQPKFGSVYTFSNNFPSDNDDDQPPSSCGGNSFTTSNPYIC
ncbi:Ubiquitin carboxyl-terminal hydrolase 35 [Pseudolycoriella hygida]|uniref:Ubiquitin carboxyl-terminal hydrolase 35 n=1 Tax=Pseudolycoriella hygida TaxID=35572 RepID=A0A9Q0S1U9_9DIPT|nr:Ubiquitin carboxyl-terminal hydrolase 35 [Pseudolycoriella hygida]